MDYSNNDVSFTKVFNATKMLDFQLVFCHICRILSPTSDNEIKQTKDQDSKAIMKKKRR